MATRNFNLNIFLPRKPSVTPEVKGVPMDFFMLSRHTNNFRKGPVMKLTKLIVAILLFFIPSIVFAQPTTTQGASGQESQRQIQQRDERLRQNLNQGEAPKEITTEPSTGPEAGQGNALKY